jgi:hypothetical protein
MKSARDEEIERLFYLLFVDAVYVERQQVDQT